MIAGARTARPGKPGYLVEKGYFPRFNRIFILIYKDIVIYLFDLMDRTDSRMETLLAQLRAIAEPSRLRLVSLCAESEMTVSELTRALGQSQPRVSRHLKLLCDAGLVERRPEGGWVFYRLNDDGAGGALARHIAGLVPADDAQMTLDRKRLEDIKHTRAELAGEYFRANAAEWDNIRSLHVDEAEVEKALSDAVQPEASDLLDIGTGTGRMLLLFAARVDRAVGIDTSREMLAVARANIEAAGLRNCQVRQGDMYSLPLPDASFDAVTIHQVLHYADRPAMVIAEVARVLRPGGRLVIADFAPHDVERLRTGAAHRRLGFSDHEVAEWCRGAGLQPGPARRLPGDPLTVVIWRADRQSATAPGRQADEAGEQTRTGEEVYS